VELVAQVDRKGGLIGGEVAGDAHPEFIGALLVLDGDVQNVVGDGGKQPCKTWKRLGKHSTHNHGGLRFHYIYGVQVTMGKNPNKQGNIQIIYVFPLTDIYMVNIF
jgi:hypothetical protein